MIYFSAKKREKEKKNWARSKLMGGFTMQSRRRQWRNIASSSCFLGNVPAREERERVSFPAFSCWDLLITSLRRLLYDTGIFTIVYSEMVALSLSLSDSSSSFLFQSLSHSPVVEKRWNSIDAREKTSDSSQRWRVVYLPHAMPYPRTTGRVGIIRAREPNIIQRVSLAVTSLEAVECTTHQPLSYVVQQPS